MAVDESEWRMYQKILGYNDEELEKFKQLPNSEDIISKTVAQMDRTIIFEITASHGCASQHRVGDKFYFDGAGNLLSRLSPKRICLSALQPMAKTIWAANELFWAGVDSNELRYKRFGCWDVGLNCGGWGHVDFEFRVEKHRQS